MGQFWKTKEFWLFILAQVIAFLAMLATNALPEMYQELAIAVIAAIDTIAMIVIGLVFVERLVARIVEEKLRELEARLAGVYK